MRLTSAQWFHPSLVRRLVFAQIITAALLWVALAAYTARQLETGSSTNDLDQMRLGASIVLPLAQSLETQPALLQQTLKGIDQFQRASVASGGAGWALQLPRIYVWYSGALLYRSADAQPDFKANVTGVLSDTVVDGKPWRFYAEDSPDRRWRFAALSPASAEAFGLTPWSYNWLVMPLLVSLPLLLLPAWLSVRFALRPWIRVAAEIASRGPKDLSPLAFAPKHRELSPLTGAVNQLLERLRLASERERSFVADAAHELRTPMAAIQINAEALAQRRLGPDEQELLRGLLKCNERASHLVSQLLTLAHSEVAPVGADASVVDIEALVQESLAQWAPAANRRGVELALDSMSANVWCDPGALRILIDNIVGNAVKYSPLNSIVHVSIVLTANVVQVEVLDNGPGIDIALRTRVFDRFYRGPEQSQTGSGLGLAIAKSIADRHAAELNLTDGEGGRGLRVIFRMTTVPIQFL
jgi:two-component system, OmpR family, sensor histidine kinase QseC